MSDRLFPHLCISQHYIPHLIVALEKIDCALEESLGESRIDNIGRIVAQHLGHILIDDFAIDLLEADQVLFGELGAVAVVECLDDFRERLSFRPRCTALRRTR